MHTYDNNNSYTDDIRVSTYLRSRTKIFGEFFATIFLLNLLSHKYLFIAKIKWITLLEHDDEDAAEASAILIQHCSFADEENSPHASAFFFCSEQQFWAAHVC